MTDQNEIRALKASFRGAVDTAASLAALADKVEGLDDHAEIDSALLDELARVASGHAVASAALRGFIGTMQTRRGAAV
jgi:hypothetical protein